ncbi:DUF5998 family protein [Kocuria rhizophila]|uniref:DUF5998 family protein n=1 Tax=Kocuria rhizophila TaxID=72000 RepID=UPI00073DB4F4|nr:DUF5998 family protein [Kocuria rhizophila]MCC5672698.1 cell wall biosynthesis glycosyltransferase [Kocuria rhizophila]
MTYSAPDGSRLVQDIEKAGFYPQLVTDVVNDSLDGRQPVSHLVQLETHFTNTELHRHITALVLAEDVLHITHVDDQQYDDTGAETVARVSTETVPISQIRSVTLSYAYHQPQDYQPGTPIMELNLAVSWTGTQQLELYPAMCEDPECQADHGYTGTAASEDVVMRISSEADGQDAVEGAREFARTLRRANVAPLTDSGAQLAAPHAGAPRAEGATPRSRFSHRLGGRDTGRTS